MMRHVGGMCRICMDMYDCTTVINCVLGVVWLCIVSVEPE